MKTQQEHRLEILERVDTLMLLDFDNLPGEIKRLQKRAEEIALRYARAHLLKYSAEHPRRNCILCVCMGTVVLHVEYCVYGKTDHYQLRAHEGDDTFGVIKEPPVFLNELADFGEAVGFNYEDWFGPIRMHAHHGVMISELEDW
jgi:hypothetical protein